MRYFAIAYLATFVIIAIPFLAAIATGHGTVTTQWWPKAASNWGLPATPLAGFVMLATVNELFAMIAAWGEELGWRGFMVPLLAERHGLLAIAAITWGVTLLYHLPAIWGGGSVWPCVLAHGAHNSFVQEMWPSAVHSDAVTPWLVGEFGVLTPIAAVLVLSLLLGRGRAKAKPYPSTPASPSSANAAWQGGHPHECKARPNTSAHAEAGQVAFGRTPRTWRSTNASTALRRSNAICATAAPSSSQQRGC